MEQEFKNDCDTWFAELVRRLEARAGSVLVSEVGEAIAAFREVGAPVRLANPELPKETIVDFLPPAKEGLHLYKWKAAIINRFFFLAVRRLLFFRACRRPRRCPGRSRRCTAGATAWRTSGQ